MILALDQGTTSSRAIVFDHDGRIRATAQKEFRQIFPKSGWVEHDPLEIWTTQLDVCRQAMKLANVAASDIRALGLTNQRETAVIWDRGTGQPIHNAIVWQDRRTAGFCEQLKRNGKEEIIASKTGLVIDAYFSASKIRWLLDNVPGARQRYKDLAFGTIDSWLVWNLTGGALHITDATNASRTMLYNLHTREWDSELLEIFDIPVQIMPAVRASSLVYGPKAKGLFDAEIPIAGIAGDQQAALFGQNCFDRGSAKNTYGTGCFMLMNIGERAVPSKHKLLTTLAWQIGNNTEFALEGSVFIAGAVVQWLRDGLGIIKSSAEIEKLAASVPDSGGVFLVPAFAGLGAPHWDQYARGTITGITRGTTSAHLARAALEGIAFQVADILEVMQQDSGITLAELRVDGGAAANDLLMQFQADLLGVPVLRPKVLETTALGAAYLAGLATGFWNSREQVQKAWQLDRAFEPRMDQDHASVLRAGWARALERAKNWEQGH